MAIAFLATACGTAQPAASGPSSTSEPTTSSSATVPSSGTTPTPQPAPEPTTPTSETPTPQPAPPPPPVTVEGTPCDITEGACIRLSTNESWLINGGKVEYGPVPITSGRPGYETPTGYFPVLYKVKDEWSRPYNAPMPYSTYFTDYGIAFHEGSLTDESHGCIHLSMEAAITYFENLHVGEQVQVVA
ncbi:L,D-transpeptidase [Actinosynnema sp. CS-041913]|uniref:L,D-transpeptidase n=1 Tax=Actinosynnema sp. CS-041913 TaxID=3239917 RepID=UPI003D8DE383